MQYEKFTELFLEVKQKAKRQCIASLLCIPIWVIGTNVGRFVQGVGGDWFTKGDAWGTVILLVLAFLFADRSGKANINLRRVRLLQGKTKLTVFLENIHHAHKDFEDPKAIAKLVKNQLAHLGKVSIIYETPLEKKKL